MNALRFLFAVHNHQPVGNFESVFERAFEDCYEPFLERVERRTNFKFCLHFSGPLWEHMANRRQACWDLVKTMAGRGQVELLSGGFYEPVLSVIPERDRIGQVRLMNEFISVNFGQRPRGLWLTERVWEPGLPGSLAAAGIEYTLLDEEHFHYAGIQDLHASYITEDQGFSLRVFPIDKMLRYLVPFHPLDDIAAYFHDVRSQGGTAILGDDGEKFGVWPGTRKWVYEDGWLDKFLDFIDREGVRMMTFSEYMDESPPAGRVYLPPASYEEMMEWVLEPREAAAYEALKEKASPEARRFIRGGFFRDYFRKYAESNLLHKRMLLVSSEVRETPEDRLSVHELYKGQCNDAYWHGVFGGLYLPHLREAVYAHLIKAEKRTLCNPGWRTLDYDNDGQPEYFLRGETFNIIAKPGFGGSLVEIDHVPSARNLTNVLSRRPETYHKQRQAVEAGEGKSIHELGKTLPSRAQDLLRYDHHPRYSALDHILRFEATVDDLRNGPPGELGDFVSRPYEAVLDGGALLCQRKGEARVDGDPAEIVIRKRLSSVQGIVRLDYEVENLSGKTIRFRFGSEWNILAFAHEAEFPGQGRAVLYGRKLLFESEGSRELWVFPLETLSQSEEGFDIIHQGYCLTPVWDLVLAGKDIGRFGISLKETTP